MDITQRPKAPSIDLSQPVVKPKRPRIITLMDYYTDEESKTWRLNFLKELVKLTHAPKWTEYLDFVTKNLSGDMTTFKEEHIKYIDRIIKEVDEKHAGEVNAGVTA